ncbi:hypothetical protein KBY93_03000 [Synechococcus sp. J7-Johnson]|uniref:hypothetical protein n=1 Tax=Synechococcus sp. J7-Johnson TaxID=2823737 RepID=UPI0020CE95B0|nr:hypothetical protein [Synechococcus sp. J7-Johnson]MCP9839601.1 hypothetical protein [Synechococcus sp. J7-Johnson]
MSTGQLGGGNFELITEYENAFGPLPGPHNTTPIINFWARDLTQGEFGTPITTPSVDTNIVVDSGTLATSESISLVEFDGSVQDAPSIDAVVFGQSEANPIGFTDLVGSDTSIVGQEVVSSTVDDTLVIGGLNPETGNPLDPTMLFPNSNG